MKIKSLALKLILVFSSSTAAIFLVVFGFNYITARSIIQTNTRTQADLIVQCAVYRIEGVMKPVMSSASNLAGFMSSGLPAQDRIEKILKDTVSGSADIFGSAAAFEPYTYSKNMEGYAPYCYRDGGSFKFSRLDTAGYNYRYQDWYQIPMELNRPVWSEPYYDEGGGNILMATYSVPFKNPNMPSETDGIVTADISLAQLTDIVSEIKILKTGYAVLLSKTGAFITHPDGKLIMNETIFSQAEKDNNPQLREMGRKMIAGETGFALTETENLGKCWIYYAPIPTNGWSIALFFPQNELMASITSLTNRTLLLSAAGLCALVIVILMLSRSITKPLKAMSTAAEIIGTGNFDAPVPTLETEDEIGRLACTLHYMQDELKEHIRRLTETTAVKQRIESELNIARDIQLSFLPKLFPPFPDNHHFDIYALIQSAKEVGGDLYDFQMLDDEHVCFVIGDVTGKGVPAALFMAVTKTLLKVTATKNLSPDLVLAAVNDDLSEGNEKAMFVTTFIGILNIRTGEVVYSNGGHNTPLIIRADNTAAYMEPLEGVVVGAMNGMTFQKASVKLNPGDMIFLYTDGVTEATAPGNELYGEDRLLADLQGVSALPIKEIVHSVLGKLIEFSQGDQADDITMLVIKYYGSEHPRKIEHTQNILR